MSNKYKHGDVVPTEVLAARLDELSDFVTKGPDVVRREFCMRIPAELDHDADLVLSQSAQRLTALLHRIEELEKDAGRYRYLRDRRHSAIEVIGPEGDEDEQHLYDTALDAAIDVEIIESLNPIRRQDREQIPTE